MSLDREASDREIGEALHRLALGDMLVLTIPRDDFAKLMALFEEMERSAPIDYDTAEFSRIGSDLAQQADGQ